MIIDMHHHWVNEPDYPRHLLHAMDAAGVERTGLMAMGRPFQRLFLTSPEPSGCVDNRDLAALLNEHRGRFFGYGFFRIGQDEASLVEWFAENGFTGVKFHIPAWNYDDERCFTIYERAAANDLICLFHTGPFTIPEPMPGQRLSSARCRPIMLEPIAQEFASLRIIIAHLGVCWGEEAATLCRIHRNIYADVSGHPDGWRASKPVEWFREMLYWPTAHRKILFGSDLHYSQLQQTIDDQTSLLERVGWTAEQIRCVLYDNMSALLTT